MKCLLSMLFVVFVSVNLFSQGLAEKTHDSNFHIKIMGGAQIINLNFEHDLYQKGSLTYNGRMGIGLSQEFEVFRKDSDKIKFSYAIGSSMLLGKNRARFEFGADLVLINLTDSSDSNSKSKYLFSPCIGYRFIPKNKKNLSIGLMASFPILTSHFRDSTLPVYIPIGITFGKYIGRSK